ncbi:MAG: hypothetical protein K2X44_03520, partial [Magnetospirillum sp.]|nr:hypothetical protein [Magnetospirillum sp.]
ASYDDLAENTGTSATMLRKTYIKTNNQANRAKLTFTRPEHVAEREMAYQLRHGEAGRRQDDEGEPEAFAEENGDNAWD